MKFWNFWHNYFVPFIGGVAMAVILIGFILLLIKIIKGL